jgi:DnaJ-class molecular chaperone
LKNHPLKHPDNMQIHLEKFHKICEAYEVLSSRKLHFENNLIVDI